MIGKPVKRTRTECVERRKQRILARLNQIQYLDTGIWIAPRNRNNHPQVALQ